MSSIQSRGFNSFSWSFALTALSSILTLGRTILLTQLLLPEPFGIYATVKAIQVVTIPFAYFGMAGAFIHRSQETEHEGKTANIFFTLRLIFLLVWGVIICVGSYPFLPSNEYLYLLPLCISAILIGLTNVPQVILIRRLEYKQVAIINTSAIFLSTLIGLLIAFQTQSIWALLSIDIIDALIRFGGWYVVKPIWRPALSFDRKIMRYFVEFGFKNGVSVWLIALLDRLDDLWIRSSIGVVDLGYYSRAYALAKYPGTALSNTLKPVVLGVYSELKEKPKQLSQAFVTINALLIRISLPALIILYQVSPSLIDWLFDEAWTPIIQIFQFLLVFAMLQPLNDSLTTIFVAVGKPQEQIKIRVAQLIILLTCLLTMGTSIGNVAISINLMAIIGVAYAVWLAKRFVSFSTFKIFAPPILISIVSVGIAYYWFDTLIAQVIIQLTLYSILLILSEGRYWLAQVQQMRSQQ